MDATTDPRHPHEALVRRFYTAFGRRDAVEMAACYHPEVTFSDPVFPRLRGSEAGDMWKMLCHRGKDLEVSFSAVQANEARGSARWEAVYTFTGTGRKVHNRIRASFAFRDGRIVEHHDDFDLWRWSRMALGTPGVLLGWTPLVRNKVRREAAKALAAWRSSPRTP